MDNYLNKFEANITEIERDRDRKAAELISARQSQGQPFPQADLLNELRQDNREVMRELQLMQNNPSYKSEWRPGNRTVSVYAAKDHESQMDKSRHPGLLHQTDIDAFKTFVDVMGVWIYHEKFVLIIHGSP